MVRQKFGQHFLNDKNILRSIVDLLPKTYKNIVEIGPGKGILTELLCKTGKPITAIEIDNNLSRYLDRLPYPNYDIIYEDVIKLLKKGEFPSNRETVIVGNLPYYISKEIFRWIFSSKIEWKESIFTIQKEVAERLVASPGSKQYGISSIFRAVYSRARLIKKIPPGAFTPSPKVFSSIVWFEKREEPLVSDTDIELFTKIIKTIFSERRKIILNTLSKMFPKETVLKMLDKNNIDVLKRPEQLNIKELLNLTKDFKNIEY